MTMQHIDPIIRDFDSLPDSAHVRLPVVMALYGVSAASIWRGVKAGTIPQPKKLTPRTTTWSVRELRDALTRKS
jgi:predicted DNA-binding transcriptional regulator AlpA